MTGILRQVLRGYRLAGYSELLAARQTCEVFEDLTGLWRKYILCISLHRECIACRLHRMHPARATSSRDALFIMRMRWQELLTGLQ